MKNKEQEIKSLTWKYFWQQKWKEIKKGLKLLGIILLLMPVMFLIGWLIENHIIIFSVIFFSGISIYLLFIWIKENWQRASKRAKEELR